MKLKSAEIGRKHIRFRVLVRGVLVRDVWAYSLEDLDNNLRRFTTSGDYAILNLSNIDGKIDKSTQL